MLNFINNKFVKIFLLKTVVLSNSVYDIFCGCLNNTEKTDEIDGTEIRGKKNAGCCDGICGNDNSDQSNIITDTSTNGDNNITNNNDIKNGSGNSNNNDKNLIENKKKNLLIKLDEIKNDNDCLVDKIAEQVIKE